MQLVDLRGLAADALDGVLAEQSATRRAQLGVDFSREAGRIRLMLELGLLQGTAALIDGCVVGYAATHVQGDIGWILNHHVLATHRARGIEPALAGACLARLAGSVRRVEWMSPLWEGFSIRRLPHAEFLTVYRWHHMRADPKLGLALLRERRSRFGLEPWEPRHEEAAARLIASAYRAYADGEIDALHRSPEAALKLVHQLMRDEQGGEPLPSASLVAREPGTGELCGVLLLRRVAPDAAQGELLCVAPHHQRRSGLGPVLVRAGLQALALQGLRSVGLQVAQANVEAARLYRRAGFEVRLSSVLCVWEGFDAHELADEPASGPQAAGRAFQASQPMLRPG